MPRVRKEWKPYQFQYSIDVFDEIGSPQKIKAFKRAIRSQKFTPVPDVMQIEEVERESTEAGFNQEGFQAEEQAGTESSSTNKAAEEKAEKAEKLLAEKKEINDQLDELQDEKHKLFIMLKKVLAEDQEKKKQEEQQALAEKINSTIPPESYQQKPQFQTFPTSTTPVPFSGYANLPNNQNINNSPVHQQHQRVGPSNLPQQAIQHNPNITRTHSPQNIQNLRPNMQHPSQMLQNEQGITRTHSPGAPELNRSSENMYHDPNSQQGNPNMNHNPQMNYRNHSPMHYNHSGYHNYSHRGRGYYR